MKTRKKRKQILDTKLQVIVLKVSQISCTSDTQTWITMRASVCYVNMRVVLV